MTKTDESLRTPKTSSRSWDVLLGLTLAAFSLGLATGVFAFDRSPAPDVGLKANSIAVRTTAPPPSNSAPTPSGGSTALLGEQIVFTGACDASGAIPLDKNTFAVADDEDNIIRIYDVRTGGPPLRTLNAAPTIPTTPEADIEAATRIGGKAYWLGSHGRGKNGQLRSERLVLLGTNVPTLDSKLEIIGEPYQGLLAALIAHENYLPLALKSAGERSATSPGGLNFEGMTATNRGSLLLGFRSPVPDGKALIAELLNPSKVLWGDAPAFAPPLLLPLGGKGIRALSSWRGDYLVVAGPRDYGTSKLYRWRGPGTVPSHVEVNFTGLNPEAFFTPEDRDEILLISDDGTAELQGVPCKRLSDATEKSFRAVWVTLDAKRVN